MQNLFAQLDARLFYEFAPFLPLSSTWQWLVLCAAFVGLIALVVWIYRRDTARFPRPLSSAFLLLRISVAVGILFFIFNLEKRSESRLVQPSRLAVLFDTSLSMGLADRANSEANGGNSPESAQATPSATTRRIDLVTQLLSDSELLTRLGEQHDLQVYRFGNNNQLELIGEFARSKDPEGVRPNVNNSEYAAESTTSAWPSRLGNLGAGLLVLGIFAMLLAWRRRRIGSENEATPLQHSVASRPVPLLIAVTTIVAGLILLAICDLADSDHSLQVSLGWQDADSLIEESESIPTSDDLSSNPEMPDSLQGFDWAAALPTQGPATRIGSAIQEVVGKGKGNSLSGILLVTDGGQNDGLPINRAIAEAIESNVPTYVIGIGDNRPFTNVRVSELNAPRRIVPGDRFNIETILQSFGLEGQTVQVQILVDESNKDQPKLDPANTDQVVDTQSVTLSADGQPISVSFEIENQEEGQVRYFARIVDPENDLDPSDNIRSTIVQAINRKTKVLLMAGGPSRDYQFLRNQLFRDDSVVLNVLLQNAAPGADQESDELLFDFPDPRDLAEFDCIVAFDPDWQKLSGEQTKGLEDWVSSKAGGLIVVAGPVFTPEWTRVARGNESIDRIRDLYPVSFFSQGSARLKLGRFGGEQPFPLTFSRAGRNARHLWLGETAADSATRWDEFEGVFGFYAVNESKPGANILAWFSDETTAIEGELPIYLASQFYGSGRVLFQASSEIWRLRRVDVDYFQNYYLNLIRWASQGRLLRDSNRGVLLLDRERCWVGDQLVVRAILRDEADQPMMQQQVIATLQRPGGVSESLPLVNVNDPARPGTFTSTFVTVAEGDYQVALPIPGGAEKSILRANVQAAIPDLEKANPERNDSLLQKIALQTGGHYYHSVSTRGKATWATAPKDGNDASVVESRPIILLDSDGLVQQIRPVDQETFLPGLPDAQFAQKLARWLLFLLVTFLCGEWVLRRLHKLA